MRQGIRWLALHGVVRGLARIGLRRGDPQARMIADPAVRTNPVPLIEELRSRGRLIKGRGVYITVDHEIANGLLRSDDFRVATLVVDLPKPLRWVQEKTGTGLVHPLEPPSLLAVEPPDHTRYRKLARSMFTSHAVAAQRDRVESHTKSLLDNVAGRPGLVDVVEHYCARLPVNVISDVLGVPDADRPQILRFLELAAASLDFGLTWQQFSQVHRGLVGFNAWLANHIQQLRREPDGSLLGQLTTAADEGGRLTDRELRGTALVIFAAGLETTVNLLANGIKVLLEHPQHLETLAARPELWPNAVEEILRFDSPVQMTVRVPVRDVDVAGTAIRRGEIMMVYMAGANRDPAVFDNPHRFEIERPNANKHLSFSSGRHFCLGAALARVVGEVGLRGFFEQYPNARLAGDGNRRDTSMLRGWSSLPVTLGS